MQKFVLTQDQALQMMAAAVDKANELGIRINVAVVDDGGRLKAFLRMDGAVLIAGEVARNKAYTAAGFGLPTGDWYKRIKDQPALLHGLVHTERMTIFGGGLPIRIEGDLVGGIGVSGGNQEQDTVCASAALAVLSPQR